MCRRAGQWPHERDVAALKSLHQALMRDSETSRGSSNLAKED